MTNFYNNLFQGNTVQTMFKDARSQANIYKFYYRNKG